MLAPGAALSRLLAHGHGVKASAELWGCNAESLADVEAVVGCSQHRAPHGREEGKLMLIGCQAWLKLRGMTKKETGLQQLKRATINWDAWRWTPNVGLQ